MKHVTRILLAGAIILIASSINADIPQLINFQGVLTDAGGTPITNDTRSVEFRIWSASAGGSSKWNETQIVSTDAQGRFVVLLGSISPVVDSVFNAPDRWLGIKVETDPEISPRIRVVAVGYSYRASSVDGALGGRITSKVSIGPGHTNTGEDAFVAGAFNSATGIWSTVGGGRGNLVFGNYGVIAGGVNNIVDSIYATVSGGENNWALHDWSTIGGGVNNAVLGFMSTIGGGVGNTVTGHESVVGGGSSNGADSGWVAVAGGFGNVGRGKLASIGGGGANLVEGYASRICGGGYNSISDSFSVISGGAYNRARGRFATVSGGGGPIQADSNLALGWWSTVSGGSRNYATGTVSTVSGGSLNQASGTHSSVGGGILNNSNGNYSTIPGGHSNSADGLYSFAAGRRAKALHPGSFVWGDSTNADFNSTVADQFNVRASGGSRIYSNSGLTAGVTLASGASAWDVASDSTIKRNIREVDGIEILDKVLQLPIKRWSYKAQDPSVEHIGPMAQDYYPLFQVGDDKMKISTIDPPSIALAAIQGLHQIVEEQREQISTLKEQLEELRQQVEAKKK